VRIGRRRERLLTCGSVCGARRRVTEIEDPILKPIMKLQERCKKQHAMHLMQEAKLRETMEPSTTGKGATPNVSQDFKERTGRSSSKGGVFDAVETIRRREVNENERLIGEMKKHDVRMCTPSTPIMCLQASAS